MTFNLFAIIILSALLFEYALSTIARWLNLRAMTPTPPAAFAHVYDGDAYRNSQDQTRDAARFALVSSTVQLVLLLGFWYAGGFAWLDSHMRALGLGTPWNGLAFIGALALAQVLVSLPFSIYETFVLEARFGFNRTTPRTFVLDWLKGLALGVVLGGAVLSVILMFFERAGDNAWWLCWLAVSVLSLAFQLIFPIWILPLFNKFERLDDGALRDAITEYAGRVGVALDGLFVIDGSRRSNRGNAYVTGFGSSKRIALFDTLIEQQTTSELVAVLAHEVGHDKRRHVPKMLLLSIAHSGVLFFLMQMVLSEAGLFAAFGLAQPSVYAGLVFFGLLFAPVEMIVGFLLNALLRRHEYEADRFAAETADADAMVSALEKLARDNLVNLTPHPLYVALNFSHPPLPQRVAAIRAAK